jgi:hypothetical protein
MVHKDFQKVNNKQIHHHQRLKEKQNNPKEVTDPLKNGGGGGSSLHLFKIDSILFARPSQQGRRLIND